MKTKFCSCGAEKVNGKCSKCDKLLNPKQRKLKLLNQARDVLSKLHYEYADISFDDSIDYIDELIDQTNIEGN